MADPKDFEGVVLETQDRLYNMLYYMTGNPDLAKDLLQETYLKAWKAFPKFRGESSAYTWLYRIATNVTRRHFSRLKVKLHASLDREIEERGFDPATDAQQPLEHAKELLKGALTRIEHNQAQALVLFYQEGYSYEEIADITGVPIGTVKSRINRGKTALREQLKGKRGLLDR